MKPALDTAQVLGSALEYAWFGNSTAPHPLVLLHDSLGSVGTWKDFPERLAAATGAMGGEVDAIDLPLGQYDLIVWPGGLDAVNDVPGALVRLRALLAPLPPTSGRSERARSANQAISRITPPPEW